MILLIMVDIILIDSISSRQQSEMARVSKSIIETQNVAVTN